MLESTKLIDLAMEHNTELKKLYGIAERFLVAYVRSTIAGSENENLFTDHGIGHSERILSIINKLLNRGEIFPLSSQEAFIFVVACLFHDIQMSFEPEARKSHAINAANLFRIEVYENLDKNEESGLRETFQLHKNIVQYIKEADELLAIAQVIEAHSDGWISSSKKGVALEQVVLGKREQIKSSEIDVPMLACLLRMGDELDCDYQRVDNISSFPMLNVSAISGWEQAKCFLVKRIVLLPEDVTTIILELDTDKINKQTIRQDYKKIKEVKNKLVETLDLVNAFVFNKPNYSWWKYNSVEFDAENKQFVDRLLLENTKRCIASEQCGSLHELLVKEHLLKDGHFQISEERHVRNWIDIDSFLEKKEYFNLIISDFLTHLQKVNVNKQDVVLGVGVTGARIASALGAFAGCFSTYLLIPNDEEESDDNLTFQRNFLNERRLIIVLDVIGSGETFKHVINTLEESYQISREQIVKVLTVFDRRPEDSQYDLSSWDHLIYPLNDEVFMYPCPISPDKCLYQGSDIEIVNKTIRTMNENN